MFTRVGIIYQGSCGILLGMQKVWKTGMSCERKQKTKDDLKEAARRTEMIWMPEEKREKGGILY